VPRVRTPTGPLRVELVPLRGPPGTPGVEYVFVPYGTYSG
jgi:hypothetical protein